VVVLVVVAKSNHVFCWCCLWDKHNAGSACIVLVPINGRGFDAGFLVGPAVCSMLASSGIWNFGTLSCSNLYLTGNMLRAGLQRSDGFRSTRHRRHRHEGRKKIHHHTYTLLLFMLQNKSFMAYTKCRTPSVLAPAPLGISVKAVIQPPPFSFVNKVFCNFVSVASRIENATARLNLKRHCLGESLGTIVRIHRCRH
jgi:hypothetical protein